MIIRIKKAYHSILLRNMVTLASGSLVAQFISLLTLPFFTRTFDASTFGILALLQMGGGLIAIFSTGYYDMAIPTVRQQLRARGLGTIALILATIICLAALAATFLWHDRVIEILNTPEMDPWIYFFPMVAFFIAIMNFANYWLLRAGKFGLQSAIRIIFAIGTALVTIALGLMHVPNGLVIGFLSGLVIGGCWALWQAWHHGFAFILHTRMDYLTILTSRYRHFPLYGSMPVMIQQCAAQIPLFVITAHYSLAITGHYAVTRNLLMGGVLVLSNSIGQVVLKHIAELQQQQQRVWPYFVRIAKWIAAFAFFIMASVVLLGPWLMSTYLGAGWEDSAVLTRMLGFNIFFWLVGNALAPAVMAVHRIRITANWQIFYGLAGPILFLFTDMPFYQFLWRSVIFEALLYAAYIMLILHAMRQHDREQQGRHT